MIANFLFLTISIFFRPRSEFNALFIKHLPEFATLLEDQIKYPHGLIKQRLRFMDPTLLISSIVGLILVSIIASAISYSRQQAMARRQKKIKRHKDQSNEILGLVHILTNVDESYELLQLLQQQVVAELSSAVELASDEPGVVSLLATEAARLKKFKAKERDNEVRSYCSSDTELNQTRAGLGKIGKMIDIFYNRHDISKVRKEELQSHIKQLTLNIEVNSNINQANDSAEQNDVVMFQLYIKQALKILQKTSIDFEDKNKRIKELSDILKESKSTNKTVAIPC